MDNTSMLRLHAELDHQDRQDVIERIHDICTNARKTNSREVLYLKLKQVLTCCDELLSST